MDAQAAPPPGRGADAATSSAPSTSAPSAAQPPSRWQQLRRGFSATRHYGGVFLNSLSTFYVISRYGIFVSKVTGPSMYPTFAGRGDFVLAEAVTPIWGRLTPGDVVICGRPVDPAENIIKRVVALEGSEVVLYPDREHPGIRKVKVPPGHVWIQGDNLTHSLDSRQYGPVPLAMVKGKVLVQVWPKLWWVESSPRNNCGARPKPAAAASAGGGD